MVKHIILSNKSVFDAWLSDQPIFCTPISNPGQWVRLGPDFPWDEDNLVYIQDDKFVEIRKAIVLGKSIQFQSSVTDDPSGWKDCSTTILHNNLKYRIKP